MQEVRSENTVSQRCTDFPIHQEKAAQASHTALPTESPYSFRAHLTFDVIQLRGSCPTVWLLRAHAQVTVRFTLFLWVHSWAWGRRRCSIQHSKLQGICHEEPSVPGTSQPSQQLSVLARKLLFTGPDDYICCRGNATAGTRIMGFFGSLQADNKGQGQKQLHFAQTADSQWSNVSRHCHWQEESQQHSE